MTIRAILLQDSAAGRLPGRWMTVGGASIPPREGREPHWGTPMNGVDFFYNWFTVADSQRILAQHGFAFIEFHTDEGANGYYLARKL